MTDQVQKSLSSSMHCLQHEGNLSKAPLYLIVSTTPKDLMHTDFTSIEMTIELNRPPKVVNILVFQDHFTKHAMVYMTPNQTTKTVTKFLHQGYILIFGATARLLSDCGANVWAKLLARCSNSSVWRTCKPCPITPRQMGWYRGPIKLSCGRLGS